MDPGVPAQLAYNDGYRADIRAPTAAGHVGCATAYPNLNVNTSDDQRPEMPRIARVRGCPLSDDLRAAVAPRGAECLVTLRPAGFR